MMKYSQSTPKIPPSWGTFRAGGTPPDPRQEISCTSFSTVSKDIGTGETKQLKVFEEIRSQMEIGIDRKRESGMEGFVY